MGRIKQGILGGFSGKVGTVIGGNWKSISYMRARPQNVKNPRTEAQLKQRSKFLLVLNLLKPLNPVLRIGWKHYANNQSPFNAATAHTLANAITGTYPNYEIDYTKVLISSGALTPIANPLIAANAGVINLHWEDNSGIGTAKATDKLLFAAVNPTKGETITVFDGTVRSAEHLQFALPQWIGNTVHAYIGFVSEDGKEVSNSHCINNFPITN